MEVSKANVDRGYAWVILSAAFTLQFMAGILAYSPGVMNIAVLEEIENDLTKTSWIGSINFGACTLLGPVAGLIQSKAGSRITAMVGGALTLIGMTVASFCKSIFGLVLTYGLVSGWIFRLSMVYDFTYVFAGTCLIFSSISAALVSVVGRKVMQGPIQTKTGMAS
ncbi:monocarboxylate transporter 14-like isoform X2 [Haliotis rufescens]|uniref:monocarboxylate transporter 14-like isoform X2 n=1 Tax=Haliotis rufescens TaxID=6454 RepID=UPI001EB03825|nr:monocarboxylate transporter 14-like isoform X2 [Haliotis rufescens]